MPHLIGDTKRYFTQMLLIRRFEERAAQLYSMGKIGGFCHLCIGQEAVCVGIAQAIQQGDSVITSYRDHGIMLALGSDPSTMMAELTGRVSGSSRGNGGSMHLYDVKRNFYGGNGIVGAQIPLGTGLGFAMKYAGTNFVSIAMMGDGAINQGQVYESFNMAKLWNLPVLYIIENNEYAMGTSLERGCATTDLYRRGQSFDITGKEVDGMDVFAVRDACLEALEYIREKKDPMILEMKTYRYRGHSMSDPANYRTKEEVMQYRNLDAMEKIRKAAIDANEISEEEFETIESDIDEQMSKVVEFALSSPEPDLEQLHENIYAI